MQTCEVWQLKPLLPGSRVLEHNRTSERRRGEGVIVVNSDDLPDGIDLPEKHIKHMTTDAFSLSGGRAFSSPLVSIKSVQPSSS
jgi:hypothetical protein